MRSRQLGQNFLRNKRTARRLVHSAGGEPDLLCVDLGAGTGSVTDSAVAIRTGPILAIEYDQRLVSQLASRYDSDPSPVGSAVSTGRRSCRSPLRRSSRSKSAPSSDRQSSRRLQTSRPLSSHPSGELSRKCPPTTPRATGRL